MSIVLEGVSKRFGSLAVVEDLHLEVADGELFVLLGASGSGKSTVLRLIAGLIAPDAGRVLLHGVDVTLVPPQQRGTGFVFQNYSLFRHMTVADNIEFGLRLRKVPAAVRFASFEPLIGSVAAADLTGIHWAIVGGESGPDARPMNPEWVHEIERICRRSGAAFFFKQWGGKNKKAAGRQLNGRTYDEMPTISL